MCDHELFTIWVGLSMICVEPAADVRKLAIVRIIAYFFEIAIMTQFLYHLEHQALKSPVTIEQIGSSSFIWPRRISKFMQQFANSFWLWLGEWYNEVKKRFSFCEWTSVTKQLSRAQISSHLITDIRSLQ